MKALIISHQILMILTTVCLISAVFIARKKTNNQWIVFHKRFASLSLALALIAGILIYSFKELHAYPHFSSFHGMIGGLTLILLAINFIEGVGLLKHFIKTRVIHRTLGRTIVFTILIAASSGAVRLIQILNG